MARIRNNSPQAVRNRNNRKRGSSFEKKVAEFLDMEVVPYSGSNARFGWSDVRDSEQRDEAFWMGECKNVTYAPDEPFTIEHEWIEKMMSRAYATGSLPFLAFMKSGKPQKYILLEGRAYSILMEMMKPRTLTEIEREYEKGSHNQVNLKIPQCDLNIFNKLDVILKVRLKGDKWYYVMSIDEFRLILRLTGYHYKWRVSR